MPECSYCSSPARGRGLCSKHWLRWKRHGNPLKRLRVANKEFSECSISECHNPYRARGWCNMHYVRWKTHGDPLKVLQEQVPNGKHAGCSVEGCSRSHYGKQLCRMHYHMYKTVPKLRSKYAADVVDFMPEQWKQIKIAFDYRCAYCGSRTELEQDHVTPISKGGNHTAANIVPACRSCNARKSDSIGKFIPKAAA